MGKISNEIREQIIELETKIAALEQKAASLRQISETSELERASHAFAALVEGNENSQKKMEKLSGKPQQVAIQARDIEAAISIGIKKLVDLRAMFTSAVIGEKIQEVRSIMAEARLSEEKLRSLAAPFLAEVAKANDAESKLVTALRELGQIVKPSKIRSDFDVPLQIENQFRDFGHPSMTLAAHILSEGRHLDGMEIGLRDPSILAYQLGKHDGIEKELDKLQPVSTMDKSQANERPSANESRAA
jgi:hypothetical protein